jgi:putative transposase
MAWHQKAPMQLNLHHSDRGTQYISHDYQPLLKGKVAQVRMSRKGSCWDSAPIESF